MTAIPGSCKGKGRGQHCFFHGRSDRLTAQFQNRASAKRQPSVLQRENSLRNPNRRIQARMLLPRCHLDAVSRVAIARSAGGEFDRSASRHRRARAARLRPARPRQHFSEQPRQREGDPRADSRDISDRTHRCYCTQRRHDVNRKIHLKKLHNFLVVRLREFQSENAAILWSRAP